jgi:predicted nucleotidyltransferase
MIFESPHDAAIEFMKNRNIQGKLLFCMAAGSIAFNTSFEHSDVDYFGVYVCETKQFLSCSTFGDETDKIVEIATSTEEEKPDMVLYEVGKFCEGIIAGQPLIILSFYSRICYESQEWKELKQHRNTFIYQQTIKGFTSYIKNQMKLMKERKKKYSKPLYHAFRLLFEIESMMNENEPIMYFENEKRDFLMGVRNQERTRNDYLNELKERLSIVLKKMNTLEKEFKNKSVLQGWLIQCRCSSNHNFIKF